MDLVNDLLDLTRLEAGRIQIEEETLAIRDAVEETACILANQARSKGLQFSVHVEDSLPVYVLGDKARLRQVLLNLAGNAVKFTESGSVRVVVLRTDCPNASERIRFEVHDTGPGISEQARPALFQRFSQADSSLARRHGGAGLGLAISRHLVELMDGSIGVDSRAGTGSVFWFELPLRLSAPSAPGAAVLPGARLG
jgi:signal transduction histidine kinase